MAITYTLGSLDISGYLLRDPVLGVAQAQWDEAGGTHADIDRQVNFRSSALVEMRMPMSITGTSADNLISLVDALRDECRKATNTLTVKPDGATNSVTFNIVRNPYIDQPWDHLYNYEFASVFELILVREPWAYGSSVTSLNASVQTLPAGISFKSGGTAAALLGDVPAPLTVTLEPNTGESAIHGAWVGWYPTADWAGYKVETDTAASWVGGTCAAGPTTYASGGASTKNTSTSYAYLNVDTQSLLPQTYLVLGRVATLNTSATGTFKLASPLSDLTPEVTVTFDGTHWEWVELGQVYLPAVQTINSAAANLRVYMKSSSATYAVAMDCIAFVPVDAGLCRWHPSTATLTAASLRFALGQCHVANVADHTYAGGHGIKAVGSGTLVAIVDEVDPNAATYSAKVTVAYTPRWERFR